MMGSAATNMAAVERAATNEWFRKAKLQLKLDKAAAKIEADKLRLAAKLDRADARTGKIEANSAVQIQRAATESQQLLAPIASDAAVATSDAESRAKLIRALPWIIGGVVVIGGIVYLRKRKGRSS